MAENKMKIGFIGLGKLGLPVALACESKGHTVCGTDINDRTLRDIRFKTLTYREEGANELLQKSKIDFDLHTLYDLKIQ